MHSNVIIRQSTVTKCIQKLKAAKSDGNIGFDSDHLINGTHKLHVMLCILLNVMISHGYTANDLLFSTIISIPKNLKTSLSSSDNYRGIALCSSICKVIDMVIIDQYAEYLYTSDLQFGFKPGHSTTLCTAVYLETINYYTCKNTDVYSCLLDASKAFDKVHYGKLFTLLLKRNLPCLLVRFLLDSYTRHQVCVSWESSKSRYFSTLNGVKQGGVLSPILFIVYIDELIVILRHSGIGCHMGGHYVGAIGYADDLTLVSPSIRALNNMLSICSKFAEEYNITFNTTKTVCIKYGSDIIEHELVKLNGCTIAWSDKVKHLGYIVNNKLTDTDDCASKSAIFNGSVNKLIGNFGGIQTDILCKLYSSYCCSFYGSQIWCMNSHGFASCCIQWNKAVRKILKLPYRCHSWLLGPLMQQCHISAQLHVKTIKFIYQMLMNSNSIVAYIARRGCMFSNSPLGRNISFFRYKYGIIFSNSMSSNVALVYDTHALDSSKLGLVSCVKDAQNVLHNSSYIEHFTCHEIEQILYNICIE